MKFIESNDIIVPYLNICFSKASIKGINISPTQQDELAKDGLLMMIRNLNYQHISNKDITLSDIPLRH